MPHPRRAGRSKPDPALLAASLEALAGRFGPDDLGDDPLLFPRRYEAPEDREVAALVAALFAYGRVAQIRRSLDVLFDCLGPRPAEALRAGTPRRWRSRLDGWVHRFNDDRDAAALLAALGTTLRAEGSLAALFARGDDGAREIRPSLARFAAALRRRGEAAGPGRGWAFLLSDPDAGGAAKRWNLFLRWVVRPGPVDLGLWTGVAPSRLVLPMDAHVGRISRLLGLTKRNANDWRAAREATDRLAAIDPADPVRFDFALCRLGILDICRARPETSLCRRCTIAPVCPVGGARLLESTAAPEAA